MKFKIGETVLCKSLLPEFDGKIGRVEGYLNDSVVTIQIDGLGVFNWPDSSLESINPSPQVGIVSHIDMPTFETINEALRFDYEFKKPKYKGIQALRIAEGLCPYCGQKGRYHLSTPVCSEHGPY